MAHGRELENEKEQRMVHQGSGPKAARGEKARESKPSESREAVQVSPLLQADRPNQRTTEANGLRRGGETVEAGSTARETPWPATQGTVPIRAGSERPGEKPSGQTAR